MLPIPKWIEQKIRVSSFATFNISNNLFSESEESRLITRKFELESLLAAQKSDWVLRKISAPLEERMMFSEELPLVKHQIMVIKGEIKELRAQNIQENSCARVEQYWGEINKILHREGLQKFIYEARENVRDRVA